MKSSYKLLKHENNISWYNILKFLIYTKMLYTILMHTSKSNKITQKCKKML